MDNLKEYIQNMTMLDEGYPFEYRGYVLKAVGGGGSPEVAVINKRTGNQIENITTTHEKFVGDDGFERFKSLLDEIIDYDPDTMRDWLDK